MIHSIKSSLLAISLVAASLAAQAQDLKIGYVNSDRVLREATPAKAAQAKLETEFSKREKELAEVANKLKAASDKLEKDAPTLAESERQRRQRELVEQDRDFQRAPPRVPGRPEPAQERRAGAGCRAREQGDPPDLRTGEVRPDPAGGGVRRPSCRHHEEGDRRVERRQVTPYRLADIVAALGGELVGDAELPIERLGSIDNATATTLSFVVGPKYRAQLEKTQAGALIVAPSLRDEAAQRGAAIVAPDPYLYFARLTQWWAAQHRPPLTSLVHPSAVVDAGATLGAGVHVGAFAVVEHGAAVNDGAVIGPHCIVGRDAKIGAYTRLVARVTLLDRCRIGERGIVHPGVVIGADGFGFAPNDGRWEKIEQLGAVRIGDDVEIGANTCIDRGALDDTLIADGVKLDNLIQIGHNVRIGEHTAMAGCAGVAGSTVIGAHCAIGGAAMILGHLKIADHVQVSAGTAITRSITKPGHYTGIFPFDDNAAWEKNAATLRHLHALRERIRDLESR